MEDLDLVDAEEVAYASLDRHAATGVVTEGQAEELKGKFAAMLATVRDLEANETLLQARTRQLRDELREEKIALENAEIGKLQQKKAVEELARKKEETAKALADAEERERVLHFEVNELTHKEAELREEVERMQKKNADTVEPELKRMEDEIADLRAEIVRADASIEEMRKEKVSMTEKVGEVKAAKQRMQEEVSGMRIELGKIKGDPDRVSKQTQNVTRACEDMRKTIEGLEVKIEQCEDGIKAQQKRINDVEAERRKVEKKLEGHREEIEQHRLGCETVQKSLEFEKQQHRDLLERRVEMQAEEKHAHDALKSAQMQLQKATKAYDLIKRELKKRQTQHDQAKALLPMCRSELKDAQADLALHRTHGKQIAASLKATRQEVDVHIHNFLKQEGIEKKKKDNLAELLAIQEELEAERDQWREEETTALKQIAALRNQKALRERELKQAQQQEKASLDDLRMKELVLMDLSKKDAEIRSKLKEFSKLYEVVKNERNSYVNAIQAASQALAEMKERIKILRNEVDILQNESVAKDKALEKERLAHQTACVERDAARLELNRKLAVHRTKQDRVKQQIEEIEKLNSIINTMERDMLALKKKYEVAVERRNYAGIQLIDRNDELCILYEKSNVHESTLSRGNEAIGEMEERIRMLKLQVAELEREIQVTRRIIPTMPEYAEKILDLQKQLVIERQKTEKLCMELETPDNPDRWRALVGEDPDEDQLAAKIQVLEERLNDKKEQILEKDLVLEEVTSLSEKLRLQASEGRAGTIQLAKQVNSYQTRIKDVTRKMMAIVSELSMYQATSMKLAQEKDSREAAVKEAADRLERGEPPTEEALLAWRRSERRRLQRAEDALIKSQTGPAGGAGMPAQFTRTTAEPRPNAYISSDVGLPQPYGRHAPFKPSEAGSTMRHIRRPEPKDIEI